MTLLKFNPVKSLLEVYCIFDPAIDQDKSNIAQYGVTRDPQYLVFKPDIKPTKFYLKNIPRGIFINILASNETARNTMLAFQYGIERIDNLKPIFLNEGVEIIENGISSWEPSEIIQLNNGDRIKYISQQDLENVFNFQTILEIGDIALKKTASTPGTKQTYLVLPTSIEIIEKMKS